MCMNLLCFVFLSKFKIIEFFVDEYITEKTKVDIPLPQIEKHSAHFYNYAASRLL